MGVGIPLVELIFPSFFPFYLSSSPSDLCTPPFFQSTRSEIGSETTDNLSEDNPVKNANKALETSDKDQKHTAVAALK